MDKLDKIDKILNNLVASAYDESLKINQKGYFSKDSVEAIGIVISLAYNRWGNESDK